jgi:rRNA-processing protein FCF1
MEVVIDTNMMMEKNILREARKFGQPIILSSVIEELKKIRSGKGKNSMKAKLALEIIHKGTNIVMTEKKGDNAILDYARDNKCIVATNDKALIRKLKNREIRILRMRQGKFLVEE